MKTTRPFIFIFALWCFIGGLDVLAQEPIRVEKIWDKGKHNAFPDLIFAKGYYYCTFREGNSHVDNTNDGQVRILRSKDLKSWDTVALFTHEEADVREARLSLMPDGRILVNLAIGLWKDGYQWLRSYVSFSDQSGTDFTPLELAEIDPKIPPAQDWIWRIVWHKGVGYGVLYKVFPDQGSKPWEAMVVKTLDGKHYELVSPIPIDGNPNECTIRFDSEDNMYVLVRRESGDQKGVLAVTSQPYTDWVFHPLPWRLGGPNFLFLDRDRLVMGSRFNREDGPRTAIFVTDRQGEVKKTMELPSGGDTSYPGMVIRKRELVFAYYSSHEGQSAIYLARIPLKHLK